MKKKTIWLMVSCLMVTALLLASCAAAEVEEEAIPEVTPSKKITLDDSPIVLDLLPLLPTGFERLDAASEGMSNKDMGLGPDFSEVEVALNEEPYQAIFTYLTICESRIEQAASDAFFKDDEMVESMIVENIKAGAAEEGVEADVIVDITHPQLGDLAMLGKGTMSAFCVYMGYDMLVFKVNTVYVFIISMYLSADNESLLPIGKEIAHRINMYSQ